jgi:alkane 1-monooxygenase
MAERVRTNSRAMPILAKSNRDGTSGMPSRPWFPSWWWGFGLSLFLPAATLAFLLSGPHEPLPALLWTLPTWLLIAADRFGPDETRPVPASAPRWFFDGLLYGLVALQVANILALGAMVSELTWGTAAEFWTNAANLTALRILAGPDFCCAAIAPAHELIHRRRRGQRLLGRLLLGSVGYDHFYVAHRLGHHARLGSGDDPSTAWPDEGYEAFFRRSLVTQWRLARRSEPRAVARGVAAELAYFLGFGLVFGPVALIVLVWQALVAVRLLEAVNYFQHFGLTLDSGRAAATAWNCDSAVSLFLFLGLTRHADHHRRPAVPYPDLRSLPDSPRLPYGYLGMALWVKNRSAGYRRWVAGSLG